MDRLRKLKNFAATKRLAFRWIVGLLFILWLVAVASDLIEDVWFREGFIWDAPVILAVHSLSRPWLDTAMRILTNAGESGAIAVALLAAYWFARRQRYSTPLPS
jgi:hypothetical protein